MSSRRARAAAGSWSRGIDQLGRFGRRPAPRRYGRSPARGPRFALGDDVTHVKFGDGVVTGTEPGGLVVVRFASDGIGAQADGRLRPAEEEVMSAAVIDGRRWPPGCASA